MKRAPHVINCSLNRTLHRLRTNGHAQIKTSKRKKSMTPMRCGAYRPKVRKIHEAFARKCPVQPACPVESRAPKPHKSP